MSNTAFTATAQGGLPVPVIASDGLGCAIGYDGSNLVFATASSPYTSWSAKTTITTSPSLAGSAAACIDGSDNIYLTYLKSSSANPGFRLLTRSGSTWTIGSEVQIAATAMSANWTQIVRESGGRLWAAFQDGSAVVYVYYSDNSGTSWSLGTSYTGQYSFAGNGNRNTALGFAGTGANTYLVLASADNGPIKYTRHLLTNTATTWSTAADSASNYVLWANMMGWGCATDATGRMMIAATPGSTHDFAVRTVYYTASNDTWSTSTDIGASTSDLYSTLASNGTDIWCFWAQFSATNSYALVYKKWSNANATWGSSTTLEAAGSNLTYVNAAFGHSTLAVMFESGTATPWNVDFDTVSLVTAPPFSAILGGDSMRAGWIGGIS